MEQNSFLDQTKLFFQTAIARVSDVRSLMWLETQLAGRTAVKITLLYGILIISALVTYFFAQVAIFSLIAQFTHSLLFSLAIMFAINLSLCLLIMWRISSLKQDLHFNATRRQFSAFKSSLKDAIHESTQS